MNKLVTRSVNLEDSLEGTIVEERDFMFDVDKEKAFKKLASKQFKNPHLALREIVSNALDAYTGMDDQRKVGIDLDHEHFEVVDYGRGFDEDKIECLRTLGQSDKRGERGYIGRFGIGFASLFHPDLGVQRVLVDTKLNGDNVRLAFNVEETGVTLKRYDLKKNIPFSTRIRAEFDNLNWKKLERMRETLEEEAKYMNADVKLNGQDISGKALFERTRKYMLDLEGDLSGRLCFYDPMDEIERAKKTEPVVSLLSHNIYVDSSHSSRFSTGRNDFDLPPFFGFANSDDLNVITSRNDFRKDERYKSFIGDVRRQVRKNFRDLCELVGENRDPELREILMSSFSNNGGLFKNYAPDKVNDACVKALANSPIFTALNVPGAFSLNEIHRMAHKQGHLLYARNPESTEFLDIQGYETPIVRAPKTYGRISLDGVETFDLDNFYGWNHQINEEFYGELVDKRILDPVKLRTDVRNLDSEKLTDNEKRFLGGLNGILGSDRVRTVLSNSGLDSDYSVNIAEISPIGVVACYNTMTRGISVNRNHPLSAQYIEESDGNTAPFYLPILAHELSHNIIGRHDNPFYEKSSELSSRLATAVARDLVDKSWQYG